MFSGRRGKIFGRLAGIIRQDCQRNVLIIQIQKFREIVSKKLFFFFSIVHQTFLGIVAKFLEVVVKRAFAVSRETFQKK